MRYRKAPALCLTLVLLLSFALPVRANVIAVSPLYLNVDSLRCDVSISGTTASCSAQIFGISGTTKISATLCLQQKNDDGTYTTVYQWSGETSQASLSMNQSRTVEKNRTYRVYVSADVTRDGRTETVEVWSADKKCG